MDSEREYLRDTLERIRACEVLFALLAGVLVWLIAVLIRKDVIGWDDLALSPGPRP